MITIVDELGDPIRVGYLAIYGCPEGEDEVTKALCEVIEISEPDWDYDDDLGCSREFPPQITVKFIDGGETTTVATRNITSHGWHTYPHGSYELLYEVADLTALKGPDAPQES